MHMYLSCTHTAIVQGRVFIAMINKMLIIFQRVLSS